MTTPSNGPGAGNVFNPSDFSGGNYVTLDYLQDNYYDESTINAALATKLSLAGGTLANPGTLLGTTADFTNLGLKGFSSGLVSVLPQSAAGTYNFNVPTTAGTPGYFLTSQGGGSTPMTWTDTSSSGAFFKQGGNSFGTTATLGTNDSNPLVLVTHGSPALTISTAGAVTVPGTLVPSGNLDATSTTVTNNFLTYSNAIVGTPANNQIPSVAYVKSIATGFSFLLPVTAATTPSFATACTYNAGAGTITANAASGAFVTDGFTFSSSGTGQRVLIKDAIAATGDTNHNQEGIYYVSTLGSGGVAWVLTRASDWATGGTVSAGSYIFVQQGSVNMNSQWVQTQNIATVGTTANTNGQILISGNTYSGTSPISVAGTAISLVGFPATQYGLLYAPTTTTIGEIAPGASTNEVLLNTASGAPTWSPYTLPASLTTNQLFYSSSATAVSQVNPTTANSVLVTDGSPTMSWANTLPPVSHGFTTTVSAAATTTLTNTSTVVQQLTGTTTQIYQLPNPNSPLIPLGFSYLFLNDSTGVLTVNNATPALVVTIPGGNACYVVLTANGSSPGSWDAQFLSSSSPSGSYLPLAGGTMSGGINMGAQAITNSSSLQANAASSGGIPLQAARFMGGVGPISYTPGSDYRFQDFFVDSLGANQASVYIQADRTGTSSSWTPCGSGIFLPLTGGAMTGALSMSNHAIISISSLAVTGSGSGTITIKPQAAAGTYNLNLPITAGSSGDVLTSGGGTTNPMTWTTLSSATVTALAATSPVSVTGSTGSVTITLSNFPVTQYGLLYAPTATTIGAITPGASSNEVLLNTSSGAPAWSPYTLPASLTTNQLLYSSSATAVSQVSPTTANSVLVTDGTPSMTWGNTLPPVSHGFSTTVSAAATTTLTNTSTVVQQLTGSTTQTFQLPNPHSPLIPLGFSYLFLNDSTGVLTVNNATPALIVTIPAGNACYVVLTANGSSPGSWDAQFLSSSSPSGSYLPLAGGTMSGNINMGTHNVTNAGTGAFSSIGVNIAPGAAGSLKTTNNTPDDGTGDAIFGQGTPNGSTALGFNAFFTNVVLGYNATVGGVLPVIYFNSYNNGSGNKYLVSEAAGQVYVDNATPALFHIRLAPTGTAGASATFSDALTIDTTTNIVSFPNPYKVVGSSSGAVTVQPQAAAGTYNFNLPITAGSSGQVLTSQAGGSTAMTWTGPYLPLSGGTMTGNINMNNESITNIATLAANAATNMQITTPSGYSIYVNPNSTGSGMACGIANQNWTVLSSFNGGTAQFSVNSQAGNAISAVSSTTTTYTYTCSNAYSTGQWVNVFGVTDTAYNGDFQIVTASSTQFTVTGPSHSGSSSGGYAKLYLSTGTNMVTLDNGLGQMIFPNNAIIFFKDTNGVNQQALAWNASNNLYLGGAGLGGSINFQTNSITATLSNAGQLAVPSLGVSGQCGLGTTSPLSTAFVNIHGPASTAYSRALYFDGTVEGTSGQIGGNDISGMGLNAITLKPSGTVTNAYNLLIYPNYDASLATSTTIPTACALYVAGGGLASGTITNAYTAYIQSPSFGTNRVALYTDSLLVNTAPSGTTAAGTLKTNRNTVDDALGNSAFAPTGRLGFSITGTQTVTDGTTQACLFVNPTMNPSASTSSNCTGAFIEPLFNLPTSVVVGDASSIFITSLTATLASGASITRGFGLKVNPVQFGTTRYGGYFPNPNSAGTNSVAVYADSLQVGGTNVSGNTAASTLNIGGSSSGVVTVQPQAAAGTYNFNLPTTAGSSGQALTSQGGGSTAMTWSPVFKQDYQSFTSNGTWTPPSGTIFQVLVFCVGGGGGGGGGYNIPTLVIPSSGAGGGSGGQALLASFLSPGNFGGSVAVTIGAGGTGGAGGASSGASGSNGNAGSATTFGSFISASGGNFGQGCTGTGTFNGGAAVTSYFMGASTTSGAGATSSGATASAAPTVTAIFAVPSGGGAGTGDDGSGGGGPSNGASIALTYNSTTATAFQQVGGNATGGTSTMFGTAGSGNPTAGLFIVGTGGGGGGILANSQSNGGAGVYGGGGGGGGACVFAGGAHGGTGGTGGSGFCAVVTMYY